MRVSDPFLKGVVSVRTCLGKEFRLVPEGLKHLSQRRDRDNEFPIKERAYVQTPDMGKSI